VKLKTLTSLFLLTLAFCLSAKELTLKIEQVQKLENTYKIYKILNITEEVKGMKISATKGKSCLIPFDKVVKTVVVCTHCGDIEIEVKEKKKSEFIDMLMNATKGEVTCSYSQDELVGYNYIGNTIIGKTPMLVSKGEVFNMMPYKVKEPKRENRTLEKFLNSVFKIVF